MKNRALLSVFLFFVSMSVAWAQSVTVSGKVIDNEGLEVIGGSVMVKGTNVGTITDDYRYVGLVFVKGGRCVESRIGFLIHWHEDAGNSRKRTKAD